MYNILVVDDEIRIRSIIRDSRNYLWFSLR